MKCWLIDRLVDDWRHAWRWWSMQLHVVGTLLAGLFVLMPAMPAELQALVPLKYRAIAVGIWAVAGIGARLLKQQPR